MPILRKKKKKNRLDARITVHRLPYAAYARAFSANPACDRESRRVAFGSIVIRNSPTLPQQSGEFLKSLLPTNSHEIVPDFVIRPIVDVSPLFRAACALVCARVASRARACAETILRREYNCRRCGMVSFPAKHA